MSAITLTLLCENTARGAGILGEHGLSFWIETGAHRVLFDTGQGMALMHNATCLGVDLALTDAIVLSHGHFDHVGGLGAALSAAPQAPVYFHPRAVEAKFSGSDPKAGARRISMLFVEQDLLHTAGRRLIATREPTEVVPGVWMTGEIPRANDFEDTGGPFYLDVALTRPDPLLDDQALFFTAREGVVVLLGCAHAGVVNTLSYIAKLTGCTTIHAVIGGMHLENAGPRRMAETLAAFRRFDVQRIGPVHCTGVAAFVALSIEFPTRCIPCQAGTRLAFEPSATTVERR